MLFEVPGGEALSNSISASLSKPLAKDCLSGHLATVNNSDESAGP